MSTKEASPDFIAKVEADINAPVDRVWDAITNPEIIRKYMFGTIVESDWAQGSKITWKGEWQGKLYEDRGHILQLKPNRLLQYSHFSPLSGLADIPENYHTVTIKLTNHGVHTLFALSQNNNTTKTAREHSEQNWNTMLKGLKELLEKNGVN